MVEHRSGCLVCGKGLVYGAIHRAGQFGEDALDATDPLRLLLQAARLHEPARLAEQADDSLKQQHHTLFAGSGVSAYLQVRGTRQV